MHCSGWHAASRCRGREQKVDWNQAAACICKNEEAGALHPVAWRGTHLHAHAAGRQGVISCPYCARLPATSFRSKTPDSCAVELGGLFMTTEMQVQPMMMRTRSASSAGCEEAAESLPEPACISSHPSISCETEHSPCRPLCRPAATGSGFARCLLRVPREGAAPGTESDVDYKQLTTLCNYSQSPSAAGDASGAHTAC